MERDAERTALFIRSGAGGSLRDAVDVQHTCLSSRDVIMSTDHPYQSQHSTGTACFLTATQFGTCRPSWSWSRSRAAWS